MGPFRSVVWPPCPPVTPFRQTVFLSSVSSSRSCSSCHGTTLAYHHKLQEVTPVLCLFIAYQASTAVGATQL
jgi:hypothetical protein